VAAAREDGAAKGSKMDVNPIGFRMLIDAAVH
jgi:hypothetical protein